MDPWGVNTYATEVNTYRPLGGRLQLKLAKQADTHRHVHILGFHVLKKGYANPLVHQKLPDVSPL
jgi:hypothetical protein